jgi:hypothetical protein
MSKAVVTMTIDDAEHFTTEQKARIIERTPEHERDARRVIGVLAQILGSDFQSSRSR